MVPHEQGLLNKGVIQNLDIYCQVFFFSDPEIVGLCNKDSNFPPFILMSTYSNLPSLLDVSFCILHSLSPESAPRLINNAIKGLCERVTSLVQSLKNFGF